MRGRIAFTVVWAVVAVAGCATSGPPPDVSGAPAPDGDSLFKARYLTSALAQADTHLPAGVAIAKVKIAPRDIMVIAATTTVIVDSRGRWLEVVTPAKATGRTLTARGIEPNVVQRLAATAAAASHTSLQSVRYLETVTDPVAHQIGWAVHMADGRVFVANLVGTRFHRAAAHHLAVTNSAPNVVSCIQKAQDDPDRIAACTGP